MNSIAHARNEDNLYYMLKDRGVNVDFNPSDYDEMDEGYGDDNANRKKDPVTGKPRVTTKPPVYSEEEDKDNGDVINYKGKDINRLFPSGYYAYYSDSEKRFIKSDDLGYIKYLIDGEEAEELDSLPFPPHDGY